MKTAIENLSAGSPAAISWDAILEPALAVIPPLWPLEDYVAVNPFLGLADRQFLEVERLFTGLRNCELLPSFDQLHRLRDEGGIRDDDLAEAHAECLDHAATLFAGTTPEGLLTEGRTAADRRRVLTAAELADRKLGSNWSSHIINDISRHCGSHYDSGQAAWPSPFKDLPLYAAWQESACISRRMDGLGIDGYRRLVAGLPKTPAEAIFQLLKRIGIPQPAWQAFLICQLFSVAGWASYLKYLGGGAASEGRNDEDLIGLLAIRLAYDVALLESLAGTPQAIKPTDLVPEDDPSGLAAVDGGVLARYLLQVAAERAHRRRLLEALPTTTPAARKARPTLQMIFCIDVRSEVFRRQLESQSEAVETFGFAGFFGMPMEYVPLGSDHGPAQCPVLLEPAFRVRESLGDDSSANSSAIDHRILLRTGRKIWKAFQTSAISCFSFVESLGLAYLPKLLTDSLHWTSPVASAEYDGIPPSHKDQLGPDFDHGSDPLPLQQRLALAEGMLRNLGLTSGFARIVVVCGHAAETVNNPYQAGLDCGACGGHSGEPNARVAAALLNDPDVRAGLAEGGIRIPDDSRFVPAVHNTTTDEIRFFDTGHLPASHAADFEQARRWTTAAGAGTRAERGLRMGGVSSADIFRRACDWSEVRPEWGLAGNAAFIVAPRSLTDSIDLGGRAFMHSYDHRNDPEFKVLELIMTAPMVVASWINLQYYASSVDNLAFGSGNKLIHNVVGQLGMLEGNGGDLRIGLPWQSVHDGIRLQHEPLRLMVLIEAPREAVAEILARHPGVADLVSNGWITLVVREGSSHYRWTHSRQWRPEPTAA